MKRAFAFLLIAVLLSACDDGVPKVADPHHPTDADGKPMKGTEFVQKYCMGKASNETCAKVHSAVSKDSTKGAMPQGY